MNNEKYIIEIIDENGKIIFGDGSQAAISKQNALELKKQSRKIRWSFWKYV